MSSYLRRLLSHRFGARAARALYHLNFLSDSPIEIRIEIGDRPVVHDGEPEGRRQAGQEPAGLVLGDSGRALVPQEPGDVLLAEADVVPGDPQVIRLSGRSSFHAMASG